MSYWECYASFFDIASSVHTVEAENVPLLVVAQHQVDITASQVRFCEEEHVCFGAFRRKVLGEAEGRAFQFDDTDIPTVY